MWFGEKKSSIIYDRFLKLNLFILKMKHLVIIWRIDIGYCFELQYNLDKSHRANIEWLVHL